jgi:y4mF family transcriptional regulator
MQAKTVRDLGALVRSARTSRGMTQADLAHELRISRDWIVRLEKGHPRLEAQRVLDALLVLGLTLDVQPTPQTAPHEKTHTPRAAGESESSTTASADPFEALFGRSPDGAPRRNPARTST